MRKLLVFLVGLFLSATGAFAQSQASTGNIEGRVADPQGAAVPNVSVTARNQDTGFEKTVNSNDDGTYTIVLLPSVPTRRQIRFLGKIEKEKVKR